MTINFNDKKASKAFQDAVVKALTEVCDKHGVSVRAAGGALHSNIKAVLKFEFNSTDPEQTAAAEKHHFALYATSYGFRQQDYNFVFKANNETFHLIGFNPSRPKFCIRARSTVTGKETAFSDMAISHIQKQIGDRP